MKNSQKEWLNDYNDFVGSDGQVPTELSQSVFENVQQLLNPNAWLVFFKLLGIHLVTGFISLSVCHQFGLNPFNTEKSLADWFMSVGGHQFCMVGCGVTFVSVSILAAGYFLTVEEIRALKRNDLLQNLSLGLISLGIFAAFGAEMALGIAGMWLLGSIVGGLLAMATVFRFKGIVSVS